MRVTSPRHGRHGKWAAHTFATWLVAGVASVSFAVPGCGSEDRPPDAKTGFVPETSPTPTSNSFGAEAGAPPTCDFGPESGVCGCTELTALEDVPNIYFVLDRSGSMQDGGKWDTTRSVLTSLIGKLGPRARFGAALFPDPRADALSCASGREVMAVRPGDAGSTKVIGPTKGAFLTATNVPASGGTPTAATLRALRPTLVAGKGRTFVVLATDGGPNCADRPCSVDKCSLNIENVFPECKPGRAPNCCDPSVTSVRNCLDDVDSIQAVKELADAGIPTYVVGFPGVGPYTPVLDRMAEAGGTALPFSPKFYEVTSYDSSAFEKSLGLVAARITSSCTITLKSVPPDPNEVNVYLDEIAVPQDATNGWVLEGPTVTLVGETCARVTRGDALAVRVVAGCPTMQPR
ncbi:MAG: vWA domain-containing protein [Polyangiaceae bacterium]